MGFLLFRASKILNGANGDIAMVSGKQILLGKDAHSIFNPFGMAVSGGD
jgi:hypothetical protein